MPSRGELAGHEAAPSGQDGRWPQRVSGRAQRSRGRGRGRDASSSDKRAFPVQEDFPPLPAGPGGWGAGRRCVIHAMFSPADESALGVLTDNLANTGGAERPAAAARGLRDRCGGSYVHFCLYAKGGHAKEQRRLSGISPCRASDGWQGNGHARSAPPVEEDVGAPPGFGSAATSALTTPQVIVSNKAP